AAANAGAFRTQQQLALAENNVGLALRRVGKMDEARQQYERTIRREEKLLTRAPHDLDLAANLALSQCNLGLVEYETAHPAAAEAAFHDAIERLGRVIAARSDDAVDKEKLAADKQKLASAYNSLG